eukprot:3148532-Rhodomonas_salina.1
MHTEREREILRPSVRLPLRPSDGDTMRSDEKSRDARRNNEIQGETTRYKAIKRDTTSTERRDTSRFEERYNSRCGWGGGRLRWGLLNARLAPVVCVEFGEDKRLPRQLAVLWQGHAGRR